MKSNKPLYQLTTCALMAAILCVLGPFSIPIGDVPITLATLILYITVYLLGPKQAAISCIIYLLLGAVGMPVFSNYQGGLAKLVGPTGGYLVGYLFLILISGYLMILFKRNTILTIVSMIIGTAVLYAFGTTWFVIQLQCEVKYALTVCVLPFIAFDLVKIVISVFLGKIVRTALLNAHLLSE